MLMDTVHTISNILNFRNTLAAQRRVGVVHLHNTANVEVVSNLPTRVPKSSTNPPRSGLKRNGVKEQGRLVSENGCTNGFKDLYVMAG